MNVLINGIGNIGTTLLNILFDYRSLLSINEVYALKNSKINSWNSEDIEILKQKGIKICTHENISGLLNIIDIIGSVDYIFDCNANTFGLKNKNWYNTLTDLKGCSAQGSEKGFGIPYMSGINDNIIKNKKFVQIVSCNTHSLASLLTTFSNNDLSDLIEADFVIVRRSDDIVSHQKLVAANVVSRHRNNLVGTHHAIDVKELFLTLNKSINIQSSDITTPSQLMHSVRFNISVKKKMQIKDLSNLILKNKFISTSSKFDSNLIFELGRKYSPYGRLYSHSIIIDNNLLLDETGNRIKGWAFIPQEGNTILSTINAFLLQLNIENSDDIMFKLKKLLIRNIW